MMLLGKKARLPTRRSVSLDGCSLSVIALVALVCLATLTARHAYDTDLWWILATGREIASTGVFTVNPFTVDAGQGIVVQQWLHDLLCWVVYDRFGMAGVACLVISLAVCVAFMTSAVAVSFNGHRGRSHAPALITSLVAFALASSYINSRPQAWTMLAVCAVFLLTRAFVAKGDARFLAPLPVVAALHSNLHASMVALDAVVFVVLVAPVSLSHRRDEGFVRRWVLIPASALTASFLATAVNPYGFGATFYLVNSLGAAAYGGLILEMRAVSLISERGAIYAAVAIATSVLAHIRRRQRPYSPLEASLAALFVIGLVACFCAARNSWVFALLWLPFASRMLSAIETVPAHDAQARRRPALICVFVVGSIAAACGTAADIAEYPASLERAASDTSLAAASYLLDMRDTAYAQAPMRLFNGFDTGGFLEFEGLAVTRDARPEIWEDAITGDGLRAHRDYVDGMRGDTAAIERVLTDCDVALIRTTSEDAYDAYLSESPAWSKAVVDGIGEDYSVFVRAGTPAAAYATAKEGA